MIDVPKSPITDSARDRRRLGVLFLLLSLGFGLGQIYVCRYQLNPDAMDYLDIAREVSAGHWVAVANGYWGTLDAVLMAPLFALHPSPASELLFAHLHGLAILVAAFFSFRWFLHSFVDRGRLNRRSLDRRLESLPPRKSATGAGSTPHRLWPVLVDVN